MEGGDFIFRFMLFDLLKKQARVRLLVEEVVVLEGLMVGRRIVGALGLRCCFILGVAEARRAKTGGAVLWFLTGVDFGGIWGWSSSMLLVWVSSVQVEVLLVAVLKSSRLLFSKLSSLVLGVVVFVGVLSELEEVVWLLVVVSLPLVLVLLLAEVCSSVWISTL